MPNVYKGTPDARQSADVAHPVSRFRPTYRAITFDGTWPDVETLRAFKPWNKR